MESRHSKIQTDSNVLYMLQHMTYFMNYFVRPIFGFAYDFVAEDYKVLCIVLQLQSNTMHPRYVVGIYSVKNQSWKIIQDIFPLPSSDLSLYVKNDPVSNLNKWLYLYM